MSSTISKHIPKRVLDTILIASKWLWILAVVAFATVFIYRKWDSVSGILAELSLSSLLLALGSMGVAKIFLSLNMHFTLRYEDLRLPFWDTFRVYNESQIAKYIPGFIWHFVGKAAMLRNRQLDFNQIKNVMFLELIWIIGSSLVFGCILLYFSAGSAVLTSVLRDRIVPGLHLLVLLMIALVVILTLCQGIAARIRYWLSQYRLHLILIFNSALLWICIGFSYYMLCVPYNHEANISFSYLAGLYAIAYLIGFIFPLAPAGIGLRESVLVFGLTGILERDTAIVIAGVNRLIFVVVELILFFVCFALGYFVKQRSL
jgi:uncharacterized membrane protein YbhN (UPF0104 family)